uniref:Fibronectin type-III domain-containing protein n=1 Tax=Oryzias sinensis TaxID=183150 RepID=A0A8C7YKF2_9TELE
VKSARLWQTNHSTSHLLTLPQNPVIEIGTNFTATCLISNTVEVTADDLYWKLSNVTISRDQYRKVNSTALSVTVPITKDISEEWLFCYCRKKSSYVVLNEGKFIHGISLRTGCDLCTSEKMLSTLVSDGWSPSYFPTVFLCVEEEQPRSDVCSAPVSVKTNPPEVTVTSEKSFPTSLLLNWTPPVDQGGLLRHDLCVLQVPLPYINDQRNYRLQGLRAYTPYTIQVRCRDVENTRGYWSDWSHNKTITTPEDSECSSCTSKSHRDLTPHSFLSTFAAV